MEIVSCKESISDDMQLSIAVEDMNFVIVKLLNSQCHCWMFSTLSEIGRQCKIK